MRIWTLILILIFVSAAWANTWLPVNSLVQTETSSVTVQSMGTGTWQVQVTVPGFELQPVVQNGQALESIELATESHRDIPNAATLPAIARLIGLRTDGDPELQIISEEWRDLSETHHLALPEDGNSTETDVRDAYLPESPYELTPRQIMGGVSLADLQITAVKYNPLQHRVRLLSSVTLQIHETGAPAIPSHGITESIAQALRPMLVNWSALALDDIIVRGTYLYITADNTVAPEQISDLVKWRKRKGHNVEVAGPTQIGTPLSTTNIKNYIQSRYNNANPPLEFVCIVGDGNGSYYVPGYTYHAPDEAGVSGIGDFGYTQLDGADGYPDICIGRLWFDTSPTLLTQVNKILRYEMNPAPRNTGSHPTWYKAAGVVGDYDNQSQSVSHIQTMRWVRERMLDAGYTNSSIDTLYYVNYGGGAISPSIIIASLNSGSSLWCYRGWNRMNTFPVQNVAGLSNVGDWPFMLTMTCNTNDFDQTSAPCLGEAFMVPNATPSNPAGVIGFVGMSSGGTHTRFNNIQMGGAVQGLLREGIHTTGGSVMRAKMEMLRDFPLAVDASEVTFFEGITSLLGDPAVDVYTDNPDTLHVDNPASISVGSNSLTLAVTGHGGLPVEDAYVNLLKGTEVFVGGYTDAAGEITLNFQTSSAETLFVTASKHNCLSAIRYTLVTSATQYVAPANTTFGIDDDNNGTSHGNGDGHVNPGETIELSLSLRNYGSTAVSGVSATLSTVDPYIAGISDDTEIYGNIAAGSIAVSADDFDFTVANYAPDGHVVQFTLTVTDGSSHTWTSDIPITLSNAKLNFVSSTVNGAGNGVLDPGESGQMYITLSDDGTRALAAGRTGYLSTTSNAVTITDNVGTFAAFTAGGTGSNQNDPFGISATTFSMPGQRIPFTCIFPVSDGFADTVHFSLTIGTCAANTPCPPDQYGYWAFDNTDVAYDRHPTYNWVEVDPDSGGSGTQLSLTDQADGGDESTVVNLPFNFRYYGQVFNQITVCTNGWLAMGGDQAAHTDFRNYGIPSSMGATGLIAPFWDDLRTSQPTADRVDGRGNHGENQLDDGGESCNSAVIINALPFTDTGNTCQHTSSSCTGGGNSSPDVFYRYYVPSGGQMLQISLCGSDYDSRLLVWSTCCGGSSALLALDSSSCADGNARITRSFNTGNIWIMIEGYGFGPGSSNCGNFSLSVTPFTPYPPGHVCTYNDPTNHRYIVEWSHVFKYNGMDNPRETFECILYQPGYPQTPTGDGEILFQYKDVTNAVDVAASNNYCTTGIENLDQTDGVEYSYFNLSSPDIPGAAPLASGRAILFTTANIPPQPPRAPTGLTAIGTSAGVMLRWRAVDQDIAGNPLDDVQYNIYRGTQYGFTPDASNLLTTTSDTVYTDNTGTGATYFYVVQARAGFATSAVSRSDNTKAEQQR